MLKEEDEFPRMDEPSVGNLFRNWLITLLTPKPEFQALPPQGVPELSMGEKIWDKMFGPTPEELMRQTQATILAIQSKMEIEWEELRFAEEQMVKKITAATKKKEPSADEIRRLAKVCVQKRVAMRRLEPNKKLIDNFASELRDWETLDAVNTANELLVSYIARTPMLRDIKRAQVNLSNLSAQKTQLDMVKEVMRDEMEMNDDVQEDENAEVEAIVNAALEMKDLEDKELISKAQSGNRRHDLNQSEADRFIDNIMQEEEKNKKKRSL